jgi:hypothetical protein
MNKIVPRYQVKLGIVPTHLKFVGGLVPDEQGRLPRSSSDKLCVVECVSKLRQHSLVPIDCVQVPSFPGVHADDVSELVSELRALDLDVNYLLMVGGADPLNPADEDKVVAMLVEGLQSAERNQIRLVSSTSIETWMGSDSRPQLGAAFEAAVAQNVQVHTRALLESSSPSIQSWHIEFLREGEFQTFTDIKKCWNFVAAANAKLGRNFFKVLVDAAHCGDSHLNVSENGAVIEEIAAADALGVFHASAKTTRGCLSTDDGWIAALLTECARTGKLEHVFVEIFHHQDPALAGLRQLDSRHGVDTCDGRPYDQVVLDGLTDVARRLNNLVARGILPGVSLEPSGKNLLPP